MGTKARATDGIRAKAQREKVATSVGRSRCLLELKLLKEEDTIVDGGEKLSAAAPQMWMWLVS